MTTERLQERVASLPARPGVYIMKDETGRVIYVGKAASLRNRVRSYFGAQSPLDSPKTGQLVAHVADLEYIVTGSDAEALILENTLIKQHKPHYNVRLKDDKTYPYLKIDLADPFPRIFITRRMEKDGGRYFGPFASAGSVRKTLDLLKRLFPYRSCTKTITGADPRPCLEYYIHRCVAPCVGLADREQYRKVIDDVIKFLEGRADQVLDDLRARMEEASERLEFERAATLRDQVRAVERVIQEQKEVSMRMVDEDVIALARARDEAYVQVFFIRSGKIIGRDHFVVQGVQGESDTSVMGSFIKQYYHAASFVPPTILAQVIPDERTDIEAWLTSQRGGRVHIEAPQRGSKRRLVRMVAENAKEGLAQARVSFLTDADALAQALDELGEHLELPRAPRRIECYDISNIQGTNAVGSMVVFEDGKPKRAHYRRFRIKTVPGPNDYAMMQEMLRRRFKHLAPALSAVEGPPVVGVEGEGHAPARTATKEKADESFGVLPDLVLIDGGKGHLAAAQDVLLDMGLAGLPVAGIAKEQEEIFVPHRTESILLPRSSPALQLVQRLRDEAHRFAITYHRNLRSATGIRSLMDDVTGIGPKRKRMLLRRFGSVQAIREAPVEEIAAVPGMTLRLARKLKESL
ncbi:MAG: excinuclease ABC subunit UvrC [Dehalococcoidia bacterium]|nr:excinuclease ABC subunit UvrC [Dehalococcoidia bacterium]